MALQVPEDMGRETMSQSLPKPLFDGLKYMLLDEHYIPELPESWRSDYQHIKRFLLSYQNNENTFNSYRRDMERFLQWCYLRAGKSVLDVGRSDFEHFLAFCQKPLKSWIGLTVERRFTEKSGIKTPNPKWRPFVVKQSKTDTKQGKSLDKSNYQLSERGFRALFAIISSFYHYLIQEDITQVNPVLLIRQKNQYYQKRQSTVIRRLSELQWGYVIETAELMAEEDPSHHERTLFIMNLLYGLYLRISELVETARWKPVMGDLHRDSEGRWWFYTVGKGNKSRDVSVSNDVLKMFKRYRKHLQLASLPSPDEKTPLLARHHDGNSITSTRYIRSIVQVCFDRAVGRLRDDNQVEEAQQLMSVTVHWLRHTGIS